MKLGIKATALLVALVVLLSSFGAYGVYADDSQPNSNVRYTQKIVSVLYDNSGSMDSAKKNEYALYALQMLMALLDDSDILTITPMNENSNTVTNVSSGIEIDLSASDRNQQVINAMQTSFLSKDPSGGTPGSTIGVTVDQLEARGLKNRDNLGTASENKEYWLVILTDGAFDEQLSGYSADEVIESHIKDFPSLRTIYLGLGSAAPDLSGSALTQKYLFTPYRAATTNDIVNAMQKVANQLSGRYTFEDSYYSVNGSKVTVDLSKADIAFKSISVIAQDSGVTLVSAKHEGKSVTISQPCKIVPEDLPDIKNGYSGVILGSPCFSGGKLTLEFSGEVSKDKLSILAEPALYINSYLEYKNGSKWERTTMQYINANLSQNDKIRVGYEVYEQAGGTLVDLAKVFGNVESSVTYAGKTYKTGEEIPLVVGNNEIGIRVSVMNGAYTMYSSVICIIEQNPTYYRVEYKADDSFDMSTRKTEAVFTVYVNNLPVSASSLSKYDWKLTVKSPGGKDADFKTTVGADGKITAVINAEKGVFGDYQVDFLITSEYGLSRSAAFAIQYYPQSIDFDAKHIDEFTNGNTVAESTYAIKVDGTKLTADDLADYTWELLTYNPDGSLADTKVTIETDGTIKSVLDVSKSGYGAYKTVLNVVVSETLKKEYVHEIKNYPSSVVINAKDPGKYSISQYQMTIDYTPMVFELLSDGEPFVFNNGLTAYSVTVDGVDVTQFAKAEGNLLYYTPQRDHFKSMPTGGEKTITVSIRCDKASSLNTSVSTTFNVVETVYSVVPVDIGKNTVDRFRLGSVDAMICFKVLRDGIPMSVEELEAAMNNGDIKIKDKKGTFTWEFWLPCGKEISVDTVNAEPVIVYKVTKDWIKPFDSYAGMLIFNGDKPIEVTYMNAEGVGNINFQKSPIWSYIWRVLVILFIIHCILYIIGFFNGKCKSLPSGVFVSAAPNRDNAEEEFVIDKKINLTFWEKYSWHIARFIPHTKKLWYHQPSIKVASLGITYGYDGNRIGVKFNNEDMYRVYYDSNGTFAAEAFSDYKQKLEKYDGKVSRPSMERNLTGHEIRTIFYRDPADPFIADKTHVNYDYYGSYDERGKLILVAFFVKRNK